MLVPFEDMPSSFELEDTNVVCKSCLHHSSILFKEGEFILTKDDPNAPDWYCAEVSQVLVDRIKVNYYTTITEPLDDYAQKSLAIRTKCLNDCSVLFCAHGVLNLKAFCQQRNDPKEFD